MFNPSEVLNAKILIVDFEELNVLSLERALHGVGYASIAFTMDLHKVCELYQKNRFDLILLDIQKPDANKFQTIDSQSGAKPDCDLPVFVFTAEPNHKQRTLQTGVTDIANQPSKHLDEFAHIHNMLKTHLWNLETENPNHLLENHKYDLQRLTHLQENETSDAQLATILAMSKLVEARDDDSGRHLETIGRFCRLIAQQLQAQSDYASVVDDIFVEDIFYASALHDIGKVAIPDKILLKPGKLAPDEFAIIKTHTLHGSSTLQSVHDRYPHNSFIKMGIQIARSHHEKWDGAGYPDGLIGDAIPLSAQIMALVDVYDALRSKRCYKESYSHLKSREIVIDCKGKHFAPAIVDAFIILESEFDRIYTELFEE